MKALLLVLYVFFLIKLYYVLMRCNKLHVLTRYKVYDVKRRAAEVKRTRREVVVDTLMIIGLLVAIFMVIGMGAV